MKRRGSCTQFTPALKLCASPAMPVAVQLTSSRNCHLTCSVVCGAFGLAPDVTAFGNWRNGSVLLPGIAFLKFANWKMNSFSFVRAEDPVVVRVDRVERVGARRPGRRRRAQRRAAWRRVGVAAVAEREVMPVVQVGRDFPREQVLANRRRKDAVLAREEPQRVDRLLRVLLRALEGGEVKAACSRRSARRSCRRTGSGDSPASAGW